MRKPRRVRVKAGSYAGIYFEEPRVRNFMVWVNEKAPHGLPLPDSTIQRWLQSGEAEEVK